MRQVINVADSFHQLHRQDGVERVGGFESSPRRLEVCKSGSLPIVGFVQEVHELSPLEKAIGAVE